MKNQPTIAKVLLMACLVIANAHNLAAQGEGRSLPAIALQTMDGKPVNASEIAKEGKPTIISFWATWCKPCIRELNAMHDLYPDWQDDTDVQIVAISIDDSRSKARVPAMVNGRDWDFDVYIDENGDFQRAMNVPFPPHTFILDKDGKIVWQHASYNPGDEEEYYDILMKIVNGETID